jgi:UDP-2,3-diacylglucosamine pyrophosphatase LpxH
MQVLSRVRPFTASIERNLQSLLDSTPKVPLSSRDRLVIFSDLHLGDGGPQDDFLPDTDLFFTVLREHYLSAGYALVLNGDIEEPQRFSLGSIRWRWTALYELFDDFSRETALYKTRGNLSDIFSRIRLLA